MPLDDLPFNVRDPQTGRQRIVFRVFCAMGYDGDRPRMLLEPPSEDAAEHLADGRVHPSDPRPHPAARLALKNRDRTHRMLMLMQLHANGQDNERSYAKHIRQWLEANGGRPRVGRRAIVDAARAPSLR